MQLALHEYEEERKAVSMLPEVCNIEALRDTITYIFGLEHGVVALEDDRLIGYLGFFAPIEENFGHCKGAFCPLGASGFAGDDRAKLASRLLAAAMNQLMQDEEITVYSVSRYAHDREVGTSFVLNGLGIRCSDAIRSLKRVCEEPHHPGIQIRELFGEERQRVHKLRIRLNQHMRKPPTYMLQSMEDSMSWYDNQEIRIFGAFDQEEIIGFMATDVEAETFVTVAPYMVNICGAYVKEEYRGSKVADDLLAYVCSASKTSGADYLGVDCETLNPTALHFWGKHFDNYTYSYSRRVDERILE